MSEFLHHLNFNLWYYFKPPWDSGISPPELLAYLADHPAGRVIDLGCGTGTNVITLARHKWQVTGIDFAPRAVDLAKRKLQNANVTARLLVGDVTRLVGIDGPFDLALDIGCFHGITDRTAYLASLNRILIPGGHWLMYGFFKSASSPHGSGLSAPDLELIFSKGFQLISRHDSPDKRGRPSAWFLYNRL
jgi:ubiquinone/menaquinone biosynthesis C-methylase UbiE